MAPKIVVSPRGHLLVDDKLCITVRGLEPKSPITFHALLEEDKKKFESYCWFTADSDGKVDLSAQESIRGTYTGKFNKVFLKLSSESEICQTAQLSLVNHNSY